MVVGARRITSKKLREHQYREGYDRSLEGKELEWDGDDNIEHMWEQVKRPMVESARSIRLSKSWWKKSKECVVER